MKRIVAILILILCAHGGCNQISGLNDLDFSGPKDSVTEDTGTGTDPGTETVPETSTTPTETETETGTGTETVTETETETQLDDCSVTACEEAQLCEERECDGDFQWCTPFEDGWQWSACTAGGCCVAACDHATGCATTDGTCADICDTTTLTTGRACSGCGAADADQSCSEGTSTSCTADNACVARSCGGETYYCTSVNGAWAWRTSASCLGGTGICQNEVCSSLYDCDGGKLDPVTNLCWENPATISARTWSASESYCNNLVHGGHSDWRLPNIDELISLLRGCQNGTPTGDLSPSLCEMTPEGCTATDICDGRTTCSSCSTGSGPASGCYWDPALGGTCSYYYWSSSNANISSNAWYVAFGSGYVADFDKMIGSRVRCVRSGP